MKRPADKFCKRPECVTGNGRHLAANCWRDDEKREAEQARRVARAEKGANRVHKRALPSGHERCGACGSIMRITAAGVERHRIPSSSLWCTVGTAPAPRPSKKAKRSGSVRAVSGGLPSLGKR